MIGGLLLKQTGLLIKLLGGLVQLLAPLVLGAALVLGGQGNAVFADLAAHPIVMWSVCAVLFGASIAAIVISARTN